MGKYIGKTLGGKTITVDAIQFNPLEPWPEGMTPYAGAGLKDGKDYGSIESPYGPLWVAEGDWITTREDGQQAVYDPTVFHVLFKPAPAEAAR